MLKPRGWVISLLLSGVGLALAQAPVIQPNGVVNAASGTTSVKGEALLVGGSIFSILGENLAGEEQATPGPPLPTSLGGASVLVDGMAAPLFYVSPGKINFQVPYAVAGRVGERLPVVVKTEAGASEPVFAFVQADAAGVFTQMGGACGQGFIEQAGVDGRPTLNSPWNSASPGSLITVFATGLGPVYDPPKDGEVPGAKWPGLLNSHRIILGIEGYSLSGDAAPYGTMLTPGLVGVSQVTVKLGEGVPEGCAVPLTTGGRWGLSQPVTMSIRRGGGACQDAAFASFASLNWSKVITTSGESPSGVEETSFSASFSSGPENLVAPIPERRDPTLDFRECRCGGMGTPSSRLCRGTGLQALEAGTVRLEGVPGGPMVLSSLPTGDGTGYRTVLPPGTMEGGTLSVVGGEGSAVGGFETSVKVPPPIQVTTPLAPGTVIDYLRQFSVAWSGGSAEALVQLRLNAYDSSGVFGTSCECRVLASDGLAMIDLWNPDGKGPVLQIGRKSEDAEVVVTVRPLASKVTRFGAPGLTREGRHEWSYEYHFQGLKIR